MRLDRTLGRPKRSSEAFRVSWDFVDDLASGDTVTTGTITAIKASDGTNATSTVLASALTATPVVSVQVFAGSDGEDYDLKFKAITTQGDTFERVVRVQVRDN